MTDPNSISHPGTDRFAFIPLHLLFLKPTTAEQPSETLGVKESRGRDDDTPPPKKCPDGYRSRNPESEREIQSRLDTWEPPPVAFFLSRHGCWREATQQKRWACSVFSPARETFGEADYLMVDPPSQHAQKRVGRAQHLHALRDEVLLLGLRARPWTHRGGHPPCDSAPSGAYPTRPAARSHSRQPRRRQTEVNAQLIPPHVTRRGGAGQLRHVTEERAPAPWRPFGVCVCVCGG